MLPWLSSAEIWDHKAETTSYTQLYIYETILRLWYHSIPLHFFTIINLQGHLGYLRSVKLMKKAGILLQPTNMLYMCTTNVC